MSDEKKLSPAQQLHRSGFERLKEQLARELPQELDRTHGRAVGGLELPPLVEGPYRLPPDNVPTAPLEKK